MVSRARFVSDAMALRHQSSHAQKYSTDDEVDVGSRAAPQQRSQQHKSEVPQRDQRHEVSRSVVSRPLPAVELSSVRANAGGSPVATLPSASLLRRTSYSDALKLSSPSFIRDAHDLDAALSSKTAATLRLQSYAHHQKLLPSVTGESREVKSALMRCRKCGAVFHHTRKQQVTNVTTQQRYNATVRSRQLAQMAVRPACTRCDSLEVESLLQHIHIRNNARKG